MSYTLNITNLRRRARERGFGGLSGLLRSLGMHRNTLNRFSSGAPVLPNSIEKIVDALNLPLDEAIQKTVPQTGQPQLQAIAPLVDKLSKQFPQYSFVLFGSRVKNRSRKFSDFDIGIISEGTLPFSDYSQMLELKEEFQDQSPYFVDLVDLSRADDDFAAAIFSSAVLLAGRYNDLLKLKERHLYAER